MTVDDIVERGFALGGLDLGPRGAPLLFVFEEQEQQDDRFVAPRDFEGDIFNDDVGLGVGRDHVRGLEHREVPAHLRGPPFAVFGPPLCQRRRQKTVGVGQRRSPREPVPALKDKGADVWVLDERGRCDGVGEGDAVLQVRLNA